MRLDAPLLLSLFAVALTASPGGTAAPWHPAAVERGGEPAPGTRRGEIDVGGRRRPFALRIPPACLRAPAVPLVVALHGEGANAETFERMTGLSALADELGFIVAYPEGTRSPGGRRDWNPGTVDNRAAKRRADDVAFLDALLDAVSRIAPVDPARIHLLGFGEGGGAALRYAAERSARVAAVAAVGSAVATREAGGPRRTLPDPAGPVSVFILHGLEDDIVPHAGGGGGRNPVGRRYAPFRELAAFWVFHNRCHRDAVETLEEGGTVVVRRYPFGGEGTEVVTVERMFSGHEWAGGERLTRRILRFFVDHPKERGR